MKHATVITKEVREDGDIEASVIALNTGSGDVIADDRYKVTIQHNLRRAPVGCMIQWADRECNLWVHEQDTHNITVFFTTGEANVNLRIW